MTRKKTRLGIGSDEELPPRGDKPTRGRRRRKKKPKHTAVIGTPKELADKDSADKEGPSADRESDADDGRKSGDKERSSPDIRATRSARLPPAPPPGNEPDEEPSATPPPSAGSSPTGTLPLADSVYTKEAPAWMKQDGTGRAVGTTSRGSSSRGSSPSDGTRPTPRATRPTLMNRISRLSMDVAGRTTIIELATIADRITHQTQSRVPPRFSLRVVVVASLLAITTLVITGALAIGWWRWIPVAFLFLSTLALIGWSMLRALPKLAVKFGSRQIPGRAAAWMTLGFGVIAGASWGVTYSVSAAAEEVGRVVWPAMAPYMPERLVALEKKKLEPDETKHEKREKKRKKRKMRKKWVEPGVLYRPRDFEVVDGGFDLVIFFHGNPDIVSEALPHAGVNALVHVTNLGVGSHPYQSKYLVPNALFALIASVEREAHKVGLPEGLKARRVALASWSAGYGALHSILLFEKQRERVDAVLILDGIHGGFRPNTKRDVDPTTIDPFVKFARSAIKNEKLMMITHSAIPTHEYTSTTEGADAMLATLGMTRTPSSASASPPKVKFKAALHAFPISKRRWLQARSESHNGDFHVLGYAGNTKEDHIAHLAQMSVTVLPPLRTRWSTPAPSSASSGAPSSSAQPAGSADQVPEL